MKSYFLGIDPGKLGAYVILDSQGDILLKGKYSDWKSMHDALVSVVDPSQIFAVLEQVAGRAKNGTKNAFSFGGNYGGWECFLQLLEIRYKVVTPQKWQTAILGKFPAGESKKRAAVYCKRKYGAAELLRSDKCHKPDDGIVDALCIAEYALNIKK